MRKIGSEKETERKKKRNVLISSIFLLLVLIFGTIGYGFIVGPGNSNTDDTNTIPEGEVVPYGDQWATRLGAQIFKLSNSPDSLSEIPVDINSTLFSYSTSTLYIDSSNQAITSQISSLFASYAPRIQRACYLSCPDENIPEKTCSDNLIIWRDLLENKVYQEENCIFIEGDLRAVEAFIYKMLGLN